MNRFVLALICISGSLAFVTSDEPTNKIDDTLETEDSITLGAPIEEEAPDVSELPKQSRDSFNFVSERQPATRPVVRNNIYNFYNYRTPTQQDPQDMTQPGQNNYQPNNYQPNGYQPNGYQSNGYQTDYRPNYQPGYQQNYQQPNYNQYYGRPNYQTYPNYYQQPQQQQQQPLQTNPQQQQQQQQQQLAPDPTQPIGYMLINKYRSPFGTITKPIAFFKTR